MTVPETAIATFVALAMIVIWLYVLVDAIRREDLSGTRKIIWILAAMLLPFLTIVLYLLVRPRRRVPSTPEAPPAQV